MSGVSAGSGGLSADSDVDLAARGGEGFFKRLEDLRATQASISATLGELNLGKTAKEAMVEAEAGLEEAKKEAEAIIEAAKQQAYTLTAEAEAAALRNTTAIEKYCADLKARADQEASSRKSSVEDWASATIARAQADLEAAAQTKVEVEAAGQELKKKLQELRSTQLEAATSIAKANESERKFTERLKGLKKALAETGE